MRQLRPTHIHQGFTLIELMIVTVIIGILLAIAVPIYNDYVLEAKLVEAQSNLADMRIRAEQYFSDNRTYAVIAPAVTPPFCTVPAGNARYFDYACSGTPDASTYTVTATANNTLGMTGAVFSVNQANTRLSTFTGTFAAKGWTSSTTCWKRRKADAC